ncbi:hypothetical protein [Streptomyces sp. NPDC005805]|uniref:hypothetical protein n=1 Tax=Streptomyces sp. NPDC005805 TaxID=3157068 RepID=UPI0033DDE6C6
MQPNQLDNELSNGLDIDFRMRALKIRSWGIALLLAAGALLTWCALILLTPYSPGSGSSRDCEARLFTDEGSTRDDLLNGDRCADIRDWPEAVALLGLSVPAATAGAAMFASGTANFRMSLHLQAIRERDAAAR